MLLRREFETTTTTTPMMKMTMTVAKMENDDATIKDEEEKSMEDFGRNVRKDPVSKRKALCWGEGTNERWLCGHSESGKTGMLMWL